MLRHGLFALGLTALLIPGSHFVRADDSPASASAKADARADAKPRMPIHFSKLDLNREQRAKVLKVQQTYDQRLKTLEAELKALQDKRDDELATILTSEQKTELASLKEAARKKREENRKTAANQPAPGAVAKPNP